MKYSGGPGQVSSSATEGAAPAWQGQRRHSRHSPRGGVVKHIWLVQGSFNQKMHMITEGTDGRYWERDGTWAEVETLPALSEAWPSKSGPGEWRLSTGLLDVEKKTATEVNATALSPFLMVSYCWTEGRFAG